MTERSAIQFVLHLNLNRETKIRQGNPILYQDIQDLFSMFPEWTRWTAGEEEAQY